MTYPNVGKTRNRLDAYTNTLVTDAYDVAGGTESFDVNVGQGMKLACVAITSDGLDGIVTVTVAPYVDAAQTVVGIGVSLIAPSGAAASAIILNVAAGVGYYGVMSYDDAGAPIGIVSMYGFKVTATVSTATAGTIHMELGSVGY